MRKTLKCVLDVSAGGGATQYLLTEAGDSAVLPAGACIVAAHYEVTDDFSASGSATLALGYEGTATAFKTATLFSHADYDDTTVKSITNSLPAKVTADKRVLATVASGTLTAGALNIWVEYYESN